MTRALLLVDIQNDFLPGGALAVPEADAILPVVQDLVAKFSIVVATQDWHPAEHGSFAANHPEKEVGHTIELNGLHQILWPVHCVQGEWGADLADPLPKESIAKVFRKGDDPNIDSYSGFFDNDQRRATGLGEWLKERGVTEVYVAGLATDYCVKFTALDAVKLGFKTYLISDACQGVNLQTADVSQAIEEMEKFGVIVVSSRDIAKENE